MKSIFFLIAACLLSLQSCSQSTLDVRSIYFNKHTLASCVVDTPDPDKNSPYVGQKLVIQWHIPYQEFAQGPIHLQIRYRLKNGDDREESVEVAHMIGRHIITFMGRDFLEGGLLSYKVDLVAGENVLAESRHKLWVEKVVVK